MNQELIALERVMKALLQGQAPSIALIHAGREHLRLIASQLLGAIHGAVCRLEQRLHLIAVGWENADADGGSHEQLVSFDPEGTSQRLQNLPGHAGDGLAARCIDEQDGELVASQSRDRVGGADTALEPCRHLRQQAVAEGVAETVVHEFAEEQPVRESGERVVVSLIFELFLGGLSLRDVAVVENDRADAGVVQHVLREHFEPDPHAVLVAKTQLGLRLVRRPRGQGGQHLPHGLALAWMEVRKETGA
jgi:hypothetical protein